MRRPGLVLCALLAALAASAVLAPGGNAANECNGIQRCVSVPGPWVVVPGRGEVDYLLECPAAKGIVGGTDALVTSQTIAVSYDAIPGSPIAAGRTTNFEVLFRAVSENHRPGEFQPFLGCVPTESSTRTTTGIPARPLGPPLDIRSARIAFASGAPGSGSLRCPSGEQLVDSWTATAFATPTPTLVTLAAGVHVRSTISGAVASASVSTSTALPASAHALVQLGVRCSTA